MTFDDASRCITTIPDSPTGLAMDCLQVLSLVLPLETFCNLQSAISNWKRTVVGSSDFDAISTALGGSQSPTSRRPECVPDSDPIFANLRSSSSPPTPAPTPLQQATYSLSPVEQDAVFLALHLLSEDYRLFSDTIREFQQLVGLLMNLAATMGLENWVDEYRRATGLSTNYAIGE